MDQIIFIAKIKSIDRIHVQGGQKEIEKTGINGMNKGIEEMLYNNSGGPDFNLVNSLPSQEVGSLDWIPGDSWKLSNCIRIKFNVLQIISPTETNLGP